MVLEAASGNHIGGMTLRSGNDISGNRGSGIILYSGAKGNVVTFNMIAGNTSTGVFLFNAPDNRIGINGAGNTVTDNALSGIDLEGLGASGNVVQANTIQRSKQEGVYLFNAPDNLIGGTMMGDGNVIQNVGFSGVHLEGRDSTGNQVQGNTISGQSRGYGVLLDTGATQNVIGGTWRRIQHVSGQYVR